MGQKLISIVTITFNAKEDLISTINSVNGQTFKEFEYIVIDGGSTDGSLGIIHSYRNLISTFVSEPDKGIYDAMNKGISLANGKYILFLNAGDVFDSDNVLEMAKPFLEGCNEDLIYGSHKTVKEGRSWMRAPLDLSNFWKMMPFSHQAVFIKSEYHKNHMYDLSFKFGADFNFLYDSYVNNRTFKKINLIISKITPGGISDLKRVECISERFKTIKKSHVSVRMKLYYILILIDVKLRNVIKRFLPQSLIQKIVLAKYKD